MSTPTAVYSQCGASADTGRIFCAKCGAALRVPHSLLPSNSQDAGTSVDMSGLKRAIIVVIKGIGILAALGFWVSPLNHIPRDSLVWGFDRRRLAMPCSPRLLG